VPCNAWIFLILGDCRQPQSRQQNVNFNRGIIRNALDFETLACAAPKSCGNNFCAFGPKTLHPALALTPSLSIFSVFSFAGMCLAKTQERARVAPQAMTANRARTPSTRWVHRRNPQPPNPQQPTSHLEVHPSTFPSQPSRDGNWNLNASAIRECLQLFAITPPPSPPWMHSSAVVALELSRKLNNGWNFRGKFYCVPAEIESWKGRIKDDTAVGGERLIKEML